MKAALIATAIVAVAALVGGANALVAETVEITAPEAGATITAKPGDGDMRAIVDGWSCGADVVEDAVATLSELSRRAAILSRQVEAGAALSKTPAIMREPDAAARLRTYDTALRAIRDAAPAALRNLTRREEQDLADFEGFETLRAYRKSRTRLQQAGVADGGATEIYMLPDCFQTIHIETLTAQIRAAAQAVAELRDEARRLRQTVANLAGV